MGIVAAPLQFVLELKKKLPSRFHVCELGDQMITCQDPHRLAREFYEQDMECGRYVSIDGNGRATMLWDLNTPLPNVGQFDLVTDFGTGEHIFDQRQVFKTIHLLIKQGGYFVFDRPTDGYGVHCYWKINRCVIEDFAAVNEYEIVKLEDGHMSRGELVRGVLRKRGKDKFRVPQQGRYKKLLRPLTGGK